MTQNGFAHFAEALVFVHGDSACAEAKRHADLCERNGDFEKAALWRRAMRLVAPSEAAPPGVLLRDCLETKARRNLAA
ncbi:MAG: hypothetical protein U1E15_14345 [Hyphomicrobiales bacterium]